MFLTVFSGAGGVGIIGPVPLGFMVRIIKVKSKVFYGSELPTGESTTTEFVVNYIYQLLAAMLLKGIVDQ